MDPESLDTMYVAGIIEDGGELLGLSTSLEGDDVFVMRLHTSDGAVAWAKQVGTTKDDRLAYGGTGLAVLEGSKGVLLMGDTEGEMYSASDKPSEIFIVQVDADGTVPERTEKTGIDYSSVAEAMELSNPMNTDGDDGSYGGTPVTDGPDLGEEETQAPEEATIIDTDKDSGKNDDNDNIHKATKRVGEALYGLLSIAIAVAAFVGISSILSRKKREATERALVFSYLQNFDLDDIDVKQAATGGWHGTYVGKLAHGLNVREEGFSGPYSDNVNDGDDKFLEGKAKSGGSFPRDSFMELKERALNKLSHSSVVRDILFMDSEEFTYDHNADDGKKAQPGIMRNTGYKDDVKGKGNGKGKGDPKQDDTWGSEII